MKIKKTLPVVLAIAVVAILLYGGSALAAPPAGFVGGGGSNVPNLINTWLNVALAAASLVSVVFIVLGGFKYITSSGNAEKVQDAQKSITYAIIGLVVIALAFAIKGFALSKLLGTDAGSVPNIISE